LIFLIQWVKIFSLGCEFLGAKKVEVPRANIKLSPLTLPLSPQTGERAGVRGKNKKGNSYAIKLTYHKVLVKVN
jgi:hypothetical protein